MADVLHSIHGPQLTYHELLRGPLIVLQGDVEGEMGGGPWTSSAYLHSPCPLVSCQVPPHLVDDSCAHCALVDSVGHIILHIVIGNVVFFRCLPAGATVDVGFVRDFQAGLRIKDSDAVISKLACAGDFGGAGCRRGESVEWRGGAGGGGGRGVLFLLVLMRGGRTTVEALALAGLMRRFG